MAKYLVVDPPSGWMYGFPKPVIDTEWFRIDPEGWYKSKGYPQSLIDEGMLKYCRHWEEDIEDPSIRY